MAEKLQDAPTTDIRNGNLIQSSSPMYAGADFGPWRRTDTRVSGPSTSRFSHADGEEIDVLMPMLILPHSQGGETTLGSHENPISVDDSDDFAMAE